MWERENSKEIRKQAQQAKLAGLVVGRPKRIKRGKECVNGLGKPKEWHSKHMRIIRDKEEVNGPGKPEKWISKLIGLA